MVIEFFIELSSPKEVFLFFFLFILEFWGSGSVVVSLCVRLIHGIR